MRPVRVKTRPREPLQRSSAYPPSSCPLWSAQLGREGPLSPVSTRRLGANLNNRTSSGRDGTAASTPAHPALDDYGSNTWRRCWAACSLPSPKLPPRYLLWWHGRRLVALPSELKRPSAAAKG